jgi:hypothetical protein
MEFDVHESARIAPAVQANTPCKYQRLDKRS